MTRGGYGRWLSASGWPQRHQEATTSGCQAVAIISITHLVGGTRGHLVALSLPALGRPAVQSGRPIRVDDGRLTVNAAKSGPTIHCTDHHSQQLLGLAITSLTSAHRSRAIPRHVGTAPPAGSGGVHPIRAPPNRAGAATRGRGRPPFRRLGPAATPRRHHPRPSSRLPRPSRLRPAGDPRSRRPLPSPPPTADATPPLSCPTRRPHGGFRPDRGPRGVDAARRRRVPPRPRRCAGGGGADGGGRGGGVLPKGAAP